GSAGSATPAGPSASAAGTPRCRRGGSNGGTCADRSRAMSSDNGGDHRPVLLVIADSLAYYGPRGGLPADDPRIWPNLVAAELGWRVELVARVGWTSRDAWWALTQDPRVWAAVPKAGAVVFGVSGMDSLPSPMPTALREAIRYLRPPALRRMVREGYGRI